MPYSFYGLTKLKWAEIEDSVISISYDAFEYCTALKRVKLSENLTNIDSRAATSDWRNPKKRLRDLHAEQAGISSFLGWSLLLWDY